MAWTFYNASGEALTNFGPVALTDLDINNGAAIGEAVIGADLFIMDNGAGGTNVKVTATEVATFIAAPTEAIEDDMVDRGTTNPNRYVSPEVAHFHPGVAKVTCKFETVGTHAIITSYNMATVSDGGALGDSDVTFTTDFANTNYVLAGGADHNQLVSVTDASTATGGCTVIITTGSSGATVDTAGCSIAFWGTQ